MRHTDVNRKLRLFRLELAVTCGSQVLLLLGRHFRLDLKVLVYWEKMRKDRDGNGRNGVGRRG